MLIIFSNIATFEVVALCGAGAFYTGSAVSYGLEKSGTYFVTESLSKKRATGLYRWASIYC